METHKKKLKEFIPSVIFLLFIGLGLLLFILLPKKSFSESEKRMLSEFPPIEVRSVLSGEFGGKFETYLADQMPMRKFFVGVNGYSKLLLGQNGLNGVYSCQDGYLINTPAADNGLLEKNIDYINEFADIVDVPLYMLTVPSTGYIMDDVLPRVHMEYRDDEYINKIKTSLSDKIEYIDVREPFREAVSQGSQVYYKTDHHWTSEGAYIAYQTICGQMGMTATDRGQFEKETVEVFFGTTYSKSTLWLSSPDTMELWKNRQHTENQFEIEINDGGEVKESKRLFFEEHLKETDKYPVYLDGNHSLVRIKNNSSESDKKLLIIKDSFAHTITPFFADHYAEIIMVDMRYYKKEVSVLAKEEGIDEVLIIYGLEQMITDKNIRALM